jgi:class 3 adenylate cyclase
MNLPIRVDLTAIDGEPGLRAEMVFELETDELEAQRLRDQAEADQHIAPQARVHRPPADRGNAGLVGDDGLVRHHSPPPAISWAVHRSIMAVDIEGSTNRTNAVKGHLRAAMYDLLESALRAAGIDEPICDPLVDRGDSVLALIHPSDESPKIRLLDAVVPALMNLLIEHNQHNVGLGFRLRMVVHAGEVHYDGRGWFGEALDVACRLLDAAEVKRILVRASSPLVVVVSETIYHSIVAQGYDSVDMVSFQPIARVRVGRQRHRGWVYVPRSVSADDALGSPGGDASLGGPTSGVA